MFSQLPELWKHINIELHVQIHEHVLLKLSQYEIYLYYAKHEFIIDISSQESHGLGRAQMTLSLPLYLPAGMGLQDCQWLLWA